MGAPAFTPGPWEVRTDDKYSSFVGAVDGYGNIAEAHQYSSGPGVEEDERLANARLIAAAPELYAALEAVLACRILERDTAGWNKPVHTWSPAHMRKIATQLEAALAKARGDQVQP